MDIQETQTPTTAIVVDVQFRPGQKVYFFSPVDQEYHTGDHLIIETARGPEYGICTGGNHTVPMSDVVSPLREVIRLATPEDERILAENREKESKAYEICLQKIEEHQLDMQLVSAEYAFDGSKLLFFFTADERVDFRDLVKSLASVFHTRIELRQIGVRDKAKMVGGLGICGRPFCCASFLDDFQPVSIKMAKTQNLSLNPTKISGTCGRLMCCLKYEQETYEDLIRNSPKVDSFVDTPDGRGTIIEVELLTGKVKVKMENNPDAVNSYPFDDIAVLRVGKAKKNDAPVPSDLAPLSGNKNSAPNTEKVHKSDSPALEPIHFRYSDESVVDEPSDSQQETPKAKKVRKPRPEKKANKEAVKEGPKAAPVENESSVSETSNTEEHPVNGEAKHKSRNRYRRFRKNHSGKQTESKEQ